MGKETDEIDAGLDTALEWRNGGWHINRDVILAEILRRIKDIEKQLKEDKDA